MLSCPSCSSGRRAARGFALGAVIAGLAVAGCGSSAGTPAANAPNAPSGGGGSGGSSSGKTLNVAVVTDLTGTDAPARKPFNEGVVSFFKTYPSVGGKKFNIHIYDGQSNPAVGPSVFRQAVSSNPVGMLDFTLSTSTAAAAPIIAGAGIPCLCIGGPDPWYGPHPKSWAFEANPSGAEDAIGYTAGMAKLLGGSLKGKHLAVSGDNTSFLVTNEKATEALAPKQGWSITTTQMGPYTEVSWSSEAAKIAKTNPQGVFDITIAAPQIVQIKAMEAAGLNKVPMVLFPGLQYSDLMSLKLPNVYIATPFPYGTPPSAGLYKAAKKYGYLSDEVSYEFALGWDQAATLREALQKCGDCSGTALEKSIEQIRNYTVPGGAAFGPISFSASNHAVPIHPELIHYDPASHSLKTVSIPSTNGK